MKTEFIILFHYLLMSSWHTILFGNLVKMSSLPTTTTSTPTEAPTMSPTVLVTGWSLTTTESFAVILSCFFAITFFFGFLIHYSYRKKFPFSDNDDDDTEDSDGNFLSSESSPLLNKHAADINNLLVAGRLMQLNTAKGLKQVRLVLFKNKEIRWELMGNFSTGKKYKLDLSEVLYVQPGKKTKNFQALPVLEELCLSLIFQSITLDIVTNSREERDILANGFIELVDNLKRTSKGL